MVKLGVLNLYDETFEIIEIIRKMPPDKLTGDTTLIKHLSDNTYGQDLTALFNIGNHIYAFYKYGNIADPGLFLVSTDFENKNILKQFLIDKSMAFPNKILLNDLFRKIDNLNI